MKRLAPLFVALTGGLNALHAQNTAFTYQGRLTDGCCPATGLYDMAFKVFDNAGPGTVGQQGSTLATNGVPVTNGLFAVNLDFGSAPFTGARRWLQMDVRTNNATPPASFVTLDPRTELTSTPYAIRALTAGSVADGGITATSLAPSPALNQLLSYNGTGLQWTDAPSGGTFSLPYASSVSSSAPLFTLNNTGSGAAMKLTASASAEFPFAVLHVDGGNANRGIYAYDVTGDAIQGDSWTGRAISGYSGGGGVGVYGLSLSYKGVVGLGDYGVWGESSTGYGVHGQSTAANGRGVSGSGAYGVLGQSDNAGGRGVGAVVTSSAPDTVAVKGYHQTTGNYGELGNGTHGVLGSSATALGSGVKGLHSPSGASGELGFHTPLDSEFFRSAGVYGVAGHSGFDDYAGFFLGRVRVEDSTIGASLYAINQNPSAGDGIYGYGNYGVSGAGPNIGVHAHNTSGTPGRDVYLATASLAGDFYGNVYVHGTVTQSSDRDAKENFESVDGKAILERVATLPITRWNYRDDPDHPHIGPMAQDFYAAFHVGLDDKSICSVDADGVALTAIKALNEVLREQALEIQSLRQSIADLEKLAHQLAAKVSGRNP
jgi:hypothetical protein